MIFSYSFSQKIVKTATKEVFFSIFMLYCEGRHFCGTRFEMVKLD